MLVLISSTKAYCRQHHFPFDACFSLSCEITPIECRNWAEYSSEFRSEFGMKDSRGKNPPITGISCWQGSPAAPQIRTKPHQKVNGVMLQKLYFRWDACKTEIVICLVQVASTQDSMFCPARCFLLTEVKDKAEKMKGEQQRGIKPKGLRIAVQGCSLPYRPASCLASFSVAMVLVTHQQVSGYWQTPSCGPHLYFAACLSQRPFSLAISDESHSHSPSQCMLFVHSKIHPRAASKRPQTDPLIQITNFMETFLQPSKAGYPYKGLGPLPLFPVLTTWKTFCSSAVPVPATMSQTQQPTWRQT